MRKLRHPGNTATRFSAAHAVAVPFLVSLAVALGVSCGGGSGGGTGGHGNSGTGGHTTNNGGGGQASSSSSSSSGTTTSTGGTGGMAPQACTGDADCAGNPAGAFCNTETGKCVTCLPTNDQCAMGQFCDPTTFSCNTGCKDDTACAGDPSGATHCNPSTHKCVQCLTENDCPAGQVCLDTANICIPGCSPTHDCAAGQTCCGTTCHDLTTDLNHCGDCSKVCTPPANATAQCTGGMCQLKACLTAFADCNGDPSDGCEWNKLQDGPCTCTPGATQSCYQGAPGTQNVGPCKAGVQTCDASGTSWGPCVGQVLPVSEICANGVDDDCDGVVDNVPDLDGDGWTVCNGDCCEVPGPGCSNPKLVNPGAFEVPGDGVDNNCDGIVDNPVTTACSTASKFSGVTGNDVAQAMDICQTTTANATGTMKKWGLISATQLHADGTVATASEAQNSQTAIKTNFGTGGVVPKKNSTLAVISSGMARAAADSGWVLPISGTTFTSSIAFPGAGPLQTYTSAHGNALLPGHCGSTTCPVGTGANDSINIRLVIRTPTNAQGFSYDFRFFSAEYQTFQCTAYNDYYLAILTSGAPGIPTDHNISFDALNNPVSVNNGFFQDCGGNGKSCGTCPYGTGALAGTGFDQVAGGATEWLTTDAPIVPGETITLDLMVFDVSDHIYDTLVLLDNFRWSLTPVTLGTHT
jgi:hypothetical protein